MLPNLRITLDKLAGAMSELKHSCNFDDRILAYPIIYFITDGYFSDNWRDALEGAREFRTWVEHSQRFAITFGPCANTLELAEVTACRESILPVDVSIEDDSLVLEHVFQCRPVYDRDSFVLDNILPQDEQLESTGMGGVAGDDSVSASEYVSPWDDQLDEW